MTRLTVHVENAPFTERERKSLGKNDQGVETFKPKKAQCIENTLSFGGLKNEREVNEKLAYIKSKYKIARWTKGAKKGQEMIYTSFQ